LKKESGMNRSWQARQAEAALQQAMAAAPALREVATLSAGKAAAELQRRSVPVPTGGAIWSKAMVQRCRKRIAEIEQSEGA
jgi:hypothetical protein